MPGAGQGPQAGDRDLAAARCGRTAPAQGWPSRVSAMRNGVTAWKSVVADGPYHPFMSIARCIGALTNTHTSPDALTATST